MFDLLKKYFQGASKSNTVTASPNSKFAGISKADFEKSASKREIERQEKERQVKKVQEDTILALTAVANEIDMFRTELLHLLQEIEAINVDQFNEEDLIPNDMPNCIRLQRYCIGLQALYKHVLCPGIVIFVQFYAKFDESIQTYVALQENTRDDLKSKIDNWIKFGKLLIDLSHKLHVSSLSTLPKMHQQACSEYRDRMEALRKEAGYTQDEANNCKSKAIKFFFIPVVGVFMTVKYATLYDYESKLATEINQKIETVQNMNPDVKDTGISLDKVNRLQELFIKIENIFLASSDKLCNGVQRLMKFYYLSDEYKTNTLNLIRAKPRLRSVNGVEVNRLVQATKGKFGCDIHNNIELQIVFEQVMFDKTDDFCTTAEQLKLYTSMQ